LKGGLEFEGPATCSSSSSSSEMRFITSSSVPFPFNFIGSEVLGLGLNRGVFVGDGDPSEEVMSITSPAYVALLLSSGK
jgi:hypothetical protein